MSKFATKAAANMFCQARYEAAKSNERLSSREGAAEEIGIDRTRLARIELGSTIPYQEEVLLMADCYKAPELKGNYCREMCPLGKNMPKIENAGLDRISLRMLSSLKKINEAKETYGERIDRVTYRAQAQGAMRKADGTARTETDQKVICLEDEEDKYRIEFSDKAAKGIVDEKQAKAAAEIYAGQWVESKNKWGKKCQAFVIAKEDRERYIERSVMVNMALLKKTWAEKAMTGAKLRVIRALLGVKGTYTRAELQRNFAIPTVIFSPDFSDPQVRQAMLTQGMNSVNNMFGTPQIGIKRVDFDTENNTFDPADLDNPAYASDTETEDDYPPMQEPDVVPEPDPESEPEPDRSMDFQCSRCGEVINERVYEYSINKFGEPLCIKCQRGGGRR